MILPIYIYGSAVLRKHSENITADYPDLDRFIADLWETMYDADGVGLAAPQVGRNVRIFVVDATAGAEEDPRLADFRKTFINAEIYERTGEMTPFTEGCLSLPKINEQVMRPSTIRIRYCDEHFVEHDDLFDGFAARVIQHEYDHLEAQLFIDHLSPLRRTLLKGKLAAMVKGKYQADYRCKLVKK
ncbi:MAG: peptide deformylase [Alistipes sp.]|nr:peptide deformylase [Alistipes sp.]